MLDRVRRRSSSVIAVDLGGTKVAVATVDPRGHVSDRVEEPVDTSDVIGQIVRLTRDRKGSAMGVAVPGLVRNNGMVWAPNLPGWDHVPLARMLKKRLDIPVFVESDRNAVVLGEAWRGAGRGKTDVIALIVGTGIGAGILSDGRLIRGSHELSGCAGWMVVSDDVNEMTSKSGALEAVVSGPAMARAYGGKKQPHATASDAAEAARKGNPNALGIFARVAKQLGHAIANLISLFDPQVIVLTGGVTNAADLFFDEMKRAVLERAQPLSASDVEIVVSALGVEANLIGAARVALSGMEKA